MTQLAALEREFGLARDYTLRAKAYYSRRNACRDTNRGDYLMSLGRRHRQKARQILVALGVILVGEAGP